MSAIKAKFAVLLAAAFLVGLAACKGAANLTDEDGRAFRTLGVSDEAHFDRFDSALLGTVRFHDGPIKARWLSMLSADEGMDAHVAFRVVGSQNAEQCQVGPDCSLLVFLLSPVGIDMEWAKRGTLTFRPVDGESLLVSASVLMGESVRPSHYPSPWRFIVPPLKMVRSRETDKLLQRDRYIAPALEDKGWFEPLPGVRGSGSRAH